MTRLEVARAMVQLEAEVPVRQVAGMFRVSTRSLRRAVERAHPGWWKRNVTPRRGRVPYLGAA